MPLPPALSPRAAALLARGAGGRILIGGSAGEPGAVLDAVAADPAIWAGRVVTGAFIPGINERSLAGLEVETIFATGGLARAAAGLRHLPLHYSAFWQLLAAPGHVGCVVWAVPPPRGDGTIGLGIAADFAGAAIAAAAPVIGVVHPGLPDVADGPRFPAARFAALVEGGGPVPAHDPGPADAAMRAIAARVVAMLRPGDTLQLGLGRVQGAVLEALPESGLTGLHYHAGMITPGVLSALEAGVIAGPVTTGVALAPPGFDARHWTDPRLRFRPVGVTHDILRLAAIPGFTAVNAALEVDLMGQASAEWRGGRQVSGQGGLVDFLRGARAAPGGRGIVALPSTAGGNSRIVARLAPGAPVTLARGDADLVVTEHGTADLRCATLDQRAERLIAIADPRHRDGLARDWDRMRKGLG